jgi:ferredoxin
LLGVLPPRPSKFEKTDLAPTGLMIALTTASVAFVGTGLRLATRPAPIMSLEEDEVHTVGVPEVSSAAEDVARLLLDEERERRVAKIFAAPEEDAYLDERAELVGEIDSSELLTRDEAAGFWPPELSTDPEVPAMLWVDEYSCIGCRWCACVARSTFKISDDYGTAHVMQQGGDQQDVIEEAIDVCPSDCIYPCSREELETLEEYRGLYQDDMMGRYYHGRRMVGEGSGGGSAAAPVSCQPTTPVPVPAPAPAPAPAPCAHSTPLHRSPDVAHTVRGAALAGPVCAHGLAQGQAVRQDGAAQGEPRRAAASRGRQQDRPVRVVGRPDARAPAPAASGGGGAGGVSGWARWEGLCTSVSAGPLMTTATC